ncbi:hypothetical protein [Peribacillus kribbensis]|uniref:lmo0954 family membrane protein n=1 Tax=Peribacillus kribbensis TaxID=356658 RepID=UPI0003FBDC7F|nr:hypothetical protein [Peribacillus kribbensis]
MKKFGLIAAGVIAAVILMANLGHIIGLVISVAILYLVAKRFVKAKTVWKRILWGGLGLIVVVSAISNIPAVLGLAAAFVLYMVFRNWNKTEEPQKESDPFTNFEREWSKLK